MRKNIILLSFLVLASILVIYGCGQSSSTSTATTTTTTLASSATMVTISGNLSSGSISSAGGVKSYAVVSDYKLVAVD